MTLAVEVAVVGAGPAGSACARILAERGRDVHVFEAARHPRVKVCGGGLVRRAARELPFEPPGVPLFAAEMHTGVGAGTEDVGVRVEREEPLLWMTMRTVLDASLVEAARAAGADVHEERAVTGARDKGDIVELDTDAGRVHARAVVVADGALSRTAAALGWTEPPARAPALEGEIEVSADAAERFLDAGRFDFDCVPDGYGWVFPKTARGADASGPVHLSVGVLAVHRGAKDLRRRLGGYLDALGLGDHVERDLRGFVIPLAPRPGPPARGRAFLVGDAFGLADPLTAEGISPALISGRLAAEAIDGEALDCARAVDRYNRALRHEILNDFAVARRLARILYGSPKWRRRLLGAFGRQMCEAMVSQIAGEHGYRELLLSPKSYLRLFWSRMTERRAVGAS